MATSEIVKAEVVQRTAMEMIQIAFDKALEQGAALEVVDRILEQQKWMIRHNEEEAFNTALKRIQRQLKKIPKRGWNPQTKSHYALAEDVDDAIQHLLDDEGMTLSFRPDSSAKADEVIVIGTLSLGAYGREYPLPMPADGKGPQGGGVMSRTHATGAAITYAKRYLKNMIFDLRFKEKDDDGNTAAGGGPSDPMSDDVIREWVDAINQAPDYPSLKGVFAQCWDKAKALRDQRAKDAFQKAYNPRKAYFLEQEQKRAK